MNKIWMVGWVGMVMLLTACQDRSRSEPAAALLDVSQFNGASAFTEMKNFLAVGPRDAGTEGALSAARYLQARLMEFGWQADIDSFTEMSPAGDTTFHNVIARRKGSGPGLLILGSHFDTKAGLPDGFQPLDCIGLR